MQPIILVFSAVLAQAVTVTTIDCPGASFTAAAGGAGERSPTESGIRS